MKAKLYLAIFFIAASALSTSATAQKVYRCGSSYSQTPCPDAIVVNVDDARSSTQKDESDTRVQHEAAAADAMEKKRVHEETQAQAERNARAKEHARKPPHSRNTTPQNTFVTDDQPPLGGIYKRKSHSRKKEPAFFTARGAPVQRKSKASTGAAQ